MEFAKRTRCKHATGDLGQKAHNAHGPDWIVGRVGENMQLRMQAGKSSNEQIGIRARECVSLLKGTKLSSGKDSRRGKWKNEYISLYAACCLLLPQLRCIANQGSDWIKNNWIESYKGSPLNIPDNPPVPSAD